MHADRVISKRRRPGERDAEAARDQILKAAGQLFARKGFQGATLRAVARAAGVSQPLIHHHFGSKRELWQAVKARVVESYGEAQAAQFAMSEASPRFLDDGLQAIRRWYQENPQAVRLGLWAQIQGDTSSWIGQREQMEFVVRMLADAQRKGIARRDVSAFHLAMAIGGMAYYWFLFKRRYAAVGEIDPEDAKADEAFFESLRRLVLPAGSESERFAKQVPVNSGAPGGTVEER
jgi:TetR/AcrR family transcriptional regulator